jgi:flagellar biosynthetic protein FlhB
MADQDRTEKATPKHRKEARKKGRAPKSSDLNGAVVLIAGFIAVLAVGGTIVASAAGAMQSAFAQIAHPSVVTSGAGLHSLLSLVLHVLLVAVAPVAATCMAAGVIANVAQVGWAPSFAQLSPSFARINPASGIKNLFGPRLAFDTLKSLAKVAVVGIVVALTLIPQLTGLAAGVGTPPAALGVLVSSSIKAIVERAAAAYLLIGIADFAYQRHRYEKNLKMTRQEIKDEMRQHALPPEVRSAIRRRQVQAARARMMAAVPTADVVVTNPTHFAVALVYDGTKAAPQVVAKGQDHVAHQIRTIAEEHGVPVISDAPLARALHATVEIGQLVPEQLWQAVAQLLAFVYRLAGRRKVLG